eukprot:TRINITY_DN36238_c0_g1_i2.p1 TRINITY_DN36238_c0_g1~~TRINITY_DN36238_c0_g1_i2.p1  ORF type:complete len:168 (+),score=19.46 TRINITY_DN36238_c0_g1_i2:78-581(+)
MPDANYVQGSWGRGPNFPHPPARADLIVEPACTTFCRTLQWEANTRASSQAWLERHASGRDATAQAPFACLGGLAFTLPESAVFRDTASLASTSPKSPSSPSSTAGLPFLRTNLSRASSAGSLDLSALARSHREWHTSQQPELALRARGWTPKPGTSQQFFKASKCH